MISFIVAAKDLFINRKKTTEEFLEMMNSILTRNNGCECVYSDYGSIDECKEILKSYPKISYLYTKPNEGQWLNISKCLNNATVYSQKFIICPVGPDLRFENTVITNIITYFLALGNIILRPQCYYLDEKRNIKNVTNSPFVLLRNTILVCKGWDERMFGWGKEDDDIVSRIYKYQRLHVVRISGFGFTHVYHDNTWAEEWDKSDKNLKIANENYQNNAQNLINSYWRIDENGQPIKV